MKNIQQTLNALPVTYWPHYGAYMGSPAGGLFLSVIRELHDEKAYRENGWDGWFWVDMDRIRKRMASPRFSFRFFEIFLKRAGVLKVQTKNAGALRYYRLNIVDLDAHLEAAKDQYMKGEA